MGNVPYGQCQYCKVEAQLRITYFNFPIKCECCGPTHSIRIEHCYKCEAQMPLTTKLVLDTERLLDPLNGGLFKKVKE
jgi:hypothetical protein